MALQTDDEYWTEQIDATRRGQLDTVKKAAAGWTTLFTATLGIFGTVSFASGFTGLSDLEPTTKLIVRILIVVAALLMLAATLLAGFAANTFPKHTNDLNVDDFRDASKTRAELSLTLLRLALIAGVATAAVVLAGSFLVLFSDKASAPDAGTSAIVTFDDGAVCGVLEIDDQGSLTLDGRELDGVRSFTIVDECPAESTNP